MMKGTYSFFDAGELVARQENVITLNGRRTILKYLAGLVEGYAGTIGVGISPTAATVNDTSLDYETGRAPVNMRSVKSYGTVTSAGGNTYLANSQLVFRGTLAETFVGRIYEVAMFSAFSTQYAAERSPTLLTAFEGNTWSVVSSSGFGDISDSRGISSASTSTAGTPVRIGSRGIQFFNSSAALNQAHAFNIRNDLLGGDFGRYSQADTIALAVMVNTPQTSALTFNVRFYTDANNYFTGSFNTGSLTASADNYKIMKLTKSQFTTTGSTPNWASIAYCTIDMASHTPTVDGRFMVMLDGLSVFPSALLTPDFVTVSRSVLASPLSKELGKALDVEYVMEFDL